MPGLGPHSREGGCRLMRGGPGATVCVSRGLWGRRVAERGQGQMAGASSTILSSSDFTNTGAHWRVLQRHPPRPGDLETMGGAPVSSSPPATTAPTEDRTLYGPHKNSPRTAIAAASPFYEKTEVPRGVAARPKPHGACVAQLGSESRSLGLGPHLPPCTMMPFQKAASRPPRSAWEQRQPDSDGRPGGQTGRASGCSRPREEEEGLKQAT